MTLEEACSRMCESICRTYEIDIGNGDLSDIFTTIWNEITADIGAGTAEQAACTRIEEYARL